MKLKDPAKVWIGLKNLLLLNTLVTGALLIFFGVTIILQGYLIFGEVIESRWGYLFFFLAAVFIVMGLIIMYFFIGSREKEEVSKYRDIFPRYQSIYYSPAQTPVEQDVKEGEKNKVDLKEEKEPEAISLGYSTGKEGNVQTIENPVYPGMPGTLQGSLGPVNPYSPYTAKAGEDKDRDLHLPNPLALIVFWLVFLIGGVMAFYILTAYSFNRTTLMAFSFIVIAFPICVAFPSFIWLSFLEKITKKNPIKMKTIYLVFALGLLSTIPAVIINSLFGHHVGLTGDPQTASQLTQTLILVAVIAPFNEEFCKAIGLTFLREDIEAPMYGFVFGMTIGLGFALMENMHYDFLAIVSGIRISGLSIGLDPSIGMTFGVTAFGRATVGPLVHGLGVGLVGYAIAYAKERKGWNYLAIPLAFVTAVLLHALWNGAVTYIGYYSGTLALLFGAYLLAMYLVVTVVIMYNLWKARSLRKVVARTWKQLVQGKPAPKES